MAASIGVRIYRLGITDRGSKTPLPFNSGSLSEHPKRFIGEFISRHVIAMRDEDVERSWYFDKRSSNEAEFRGYIRYGTFGFESNLVDSKTKVKNYTRRVSDVEEIPLYYEFWFPRNADYALVAFQSFQGRSCINLVMSSIRENFEKANRDCVMRFNKIMPSNLKGSLFFRSPIKRLRLIKRNARTDVADSYLRNIASEPIDIEISLVARRRRNLGPLGSLLGKLPPDTAGVLEHEGAAFDEAVAEVQFGGRLRKVGVFGSRGDAGVIDISDSIERGLDGHPTFLSLQRETTALLKDFHKAFTGRQL